MLPFVYKEIRQITGYHRYGDCSQSAGIGYQFRNVPHTSTKQAEFVSSNIN
jgi:hypothetical protein